MAGKKRYASSNKARDEQKDALLKNYTGFLSRNKKSSSHRDDPEHGNNVRSSSSHHHQQQQRRFNTNVEQFSISPSMTLCPRCDTWFVLAVTSCAAVSSFAQITASASSKGGPADKLALSVCAISFAFSTVIACGMRYAPFRTAFTSTSRGRAVNLLQVMMQTANITSEVLVLVFLSIMWLCGIPVIVNGSIGGADSIDLAVVGTDIWNSNLFYSAWLSAMLTWYLTVEIITLHDRNGVIPRFPELNSRYRGWNSNALTKRWTLISLVAVIMLSSSMRMYNGPNCVGLLKSTRYCSLSLVGVILGGVFQLILCLGVVVIYRLSSMRNYAHVFSLEKRNKSTFGIGVLSVLIQSINVGLLTSPTGGGPGTTSGTVYFASWAGFILVFDMVLRYVEFFSTYGADGRRIVEVSPRPPEETRSRRSNKSSGTASTSDAEQHQDHPVLVQIESAPPPLPALPPSMQEKVVGPPAASKAAPTSTHLVLHPQKEPPDVYSVGSAPKLDPEESTSGGGSMYQNRRSRDSTSKSSSKGSGKSPEGSYLERRVFGQQTSFHADKMEELDQSKPQIHTAPPPPRPGPPGGRRSKSPDRLTSLDEVTNEKSTPSNDMSSGFVSIGSASQYEQPQNRPSSRGSNRPSSRGKRSTTSSAKHSAPRSRPNSRPNSRSSVDHDSAPSTSPDAPPTISDDGDLATQSTVSDYLQRSRQPSSRANSRQSSGRMSGSRSKASKGPPPPPFLRGAEKVASASSSRASARPLQSVHAYGGTHFDMSEPTIDVAFETAAPIATENEARRFAMKMPSNRTMAADDGGETNSHQSYEKKCSDSTDAAKTLRRSSSDDPPSSDSNEKEQVDDIVAAALAYAEQSHVDEGRPTLSSAKRPSMSGESIHSFYSKSHANSYGSTDHSVDDMVARVLSQAAEEQKEQAEREKKNSATTRMGSSSLYSEYSSNSSSHFGGQFNC